MPRSGAAGADAVRGGVRRVGADHGVGPGGDLAEELVEREPHGVGQHERAGQERDAERDRRGGQDEAELVREHPAQGGVNMVSGS